MHEIAAVPHLLAGDDFNDFSLFCSPSLPATEEGKCKAHYSEEFADQLPDKELAPINVVLLQMMTSG